GGQEREGREPKASDDVWRLGAGYAAGAPQRRARFRVRDGSLVALRRSRNGGRVELVDVLDQIVGDEVADRDLLLQHAVLGQEIDVGRVVLFGVLPPSGDAASRR